MESASSLRPDALLIQLNPPLWLETVKGPGLAHFMIDYGIESSLYWVVFTDKGEVWRVPNEDVKACKNYSAYRDKT